MGVVTAILRKNGELWAAIFASTIQVIFDPEEPPMPGKVTTEQAIHFAEALLRGQKDAMKILKTVALDEIREVV